jgi:hypothetical protein
MNYPTGELEWSYSADMATPGSERTAAAEFRPGDLPGVSPTIHPVLNPALAERWIAGGRAHHLPEPDFHAMVALLRQTAPIAIETSHLRLAMLLRYHRLMDERAAAVRAIEGPPTTTWAYAENPSGVVTPERINPEWEAAPYEFRGVDFTETRIGGAPRIEPIVYRRATVNPTPGAPVPYDREALDAAETFRRIQALPERTRNKLYFRRAELNRAATKKPYRFKPKFRKLLLRRMANARVFLSEKAHDALGARSSDRIDGAELVTLGYDPGRIGGIACGFFNNAGKMFKPL